MSYLLNYVFFILSPASDFINKSLSTTALTELDIVVQSPQGDRSGGIKP